MKQKNWATSRNALIKAVAGAIIMFAVTAIVIALLGGCTVSAEYTEKQNTLEAGNRLANAQPTPTDIEYSLERENLIRRAYWVNGEREKAQSYKSAVNRPLGYAVLMLESGAVVGRFTVDGKVSSLNSYLTPDSEEYSSSYSKWLPDIDGSYGENTPGGKFFFTVDGRYIEWDGRILFSDIPFEIDNPIVKYEPADTQ